MWGWAVNVRMTMAVPESVSVVVLGRTLASELVAGQVEPGWRGLRGRV